MNTQEIWQAEVNGQIYDADLEELAQWIYEGAILPQDKVRRGSLRWIEAGKAPLLIEFFNAKDNKVVPPILTTTANLQTNAEFSVNEAAHDLPQKNLVRDIQAIKTEGFSNGQSPPPLSGFCINHSDETAVFICESCLSGFCRVCPKSFGSVKICPICGDMCKYAKESNQPQAGNYHHQPGSIEKFGIGDLANALAIPFKFKASLIMGALMFMFFTLGQSAGLFGGFMIVGAIFCALLSNALVFGILANTVNNYAQGEINKSFMPDFDDFSAWDDVIHPFFLSIGTYLVSFGLVIILGIGAAWFAVRSLSRIETGKEKIVSTVLPNGANDLNSAGQITQMRQMAEQLKKDGKWQNGNMPDANAISQMQSGNSRQEAELSQLREMIKKSQQSQLQSINGTENTNENFNQFAKDMARSSLIFSIPIFLAFLWGIFYFPAACAVAGYTRSFAATLNPFVGFDTIKRLGVDYFKVLAMCFMLAVFSVIVNVILGIIFAPLDLPQLGNLPAKAVASLFTFYLTIVFSLILGLALYKNSHRLQLIRS